MEIIRDKIKQAERLLEEFDIDMWLLFVRETSVLSDPVMPLVVGHDVVWPSFFIYTRSGDAIALVGNLDAEDFRRSGNFTEVITYTEGVSKEIRKLLARFDPSTIGINYSRDNATSDGITYGMFLMLQEFLSGTPYVERLISGEEIGARIRSRKSPLEISRIGAAADKTLEAWDKSVEQIKTGMSEIVIAGIIDRSMTDLGVSPAFEAIVNAGDKTQPGHGAPTDAILEPGDLLHVDFGAQKDQYCADLQRLIYFLRPGETEVPPELTRAFNLVRDIITKTATMCRPGVRGVEIDTEARRMLTAAGYSEYQHALGHQLGRAVHDGGALIGPRWERYGPTPDIPLEINNVFTLELEIILPGIGCVGLEEDVCITENGGHFLADRQQELVTK